MKLNPKPDCNLIHKPFEAAVSLLLSTMEALNSCFTAPEEENRSYFVSEKRTASLVIGMHRTDYRPILASRAYSRPTRLRRSLKR